MRIVVALAAFLGLTSVILGAASDHLLAGKLTPDISHTFDVALRYHQLYAVLIFCAGLYALAHPIGKLYRLSMILFLLGTSLFCGSLYLYVFTGLKLFGYFTPVGGLTLMAAWVLAMCNFFKKSNVGK